MEKEVIGGGGGGSNGERAFVETCQALMNVDDKRRLEWWAIHLGGVRCVNVWMYSRVTSHVGPYVSNNAPSLLTYWYILWTYLEDQPPFPGPTCVLYQ